MMKIQTIWSAVIGVAAVVGGVAAEEKAPPKIEITLDTSAAPEMAEWGKKAMELCEQNYAMIVGELAEEGVEPPSRATLTFNHDPGIADTRGRAIRCSAKWFLDHPDDYGAVVHEMAHVVQAYRSRNSPGWLVEGIADYVRWFRYEPVNRRPRFDPRQHKYTDSYQVTGAFLDWIVQNKNPDFVRKMNVEMRHGRYKPELWKEFAGEELDALWAGFAEAKR